jgi:hypothetical protein
MNTLSKKNGDLLIREIEQHEHEHFKQLLDEKHPQHEPAHVGRELQIVVERNGEWIAILLWTSACQRLQDRDEWIGWTNAQRAQRLNLIVQLRRYLLLSPPATQHNLASEVLAASTKTIVELWKNRFGYEPLLLESFCDIEAHAGTCYKAAGWEAAGLTKGYAKHRGDYYTFHGRPKKLFLRRLGKRAVQWISAPHLPKRYAIGETACAHGQMPIKASQMRSLSDALRRTADPRAKNRQFPLGAVLSVIAMALLSGARDISQILRFSWRLLPIQRASLGFRRKPNEKIYRMPNYSVYRDILKGLDLEAFAKNLSDWLSLNRGSLPAALALDGKMIRDTIGVLSVVDVETGVPVAMSIITEKKGDGEHCEKIVARTVVSKMPDGQGCIISGDALHTDKTMARLSVENGMDYLLQVKGNQPRLKKRISQKTSNTPFLT